MKKLVVGVRFRESGKMYYFEPGELELSKGDSVIVVTSNGEGFGRVVLSPTEMEISEEMRASLFPVTRKATEEDIKRNEELERLSEEAWQIFNERVAYRKLGMRLIDVQYTFDGRKVIFYFTAEGRVDFRDLVKDLAGCFHARIELRQIGVRDEARKFSTIGICGRQCCCSTWLNDFVPVSIRMAKEQNLSLNSTKISGVCGRLLCCLTYEEDYYEEISKRMPHIGDRIMTPLGKGTVYKLRTLEEAVLVKIVNENNETEIKRFTLEELEKAKNMPDPAEKRKRQEEIMARYKPQQLFKPIIPPSKQPPKKGDLAHDPVAKPVKKSNRPYTDPPKKTLAKGDPPARKLDRGDPRYGSMGDPRSNTRKPTKKRSKNTYSNKDRSFGKPRTAKHKLHQKIKTRSKQKKRLQKNHK